MARRRFNIFRDGQVHVCARLCNTCIFRPDSVLKDVPIKAQALKAGTAVVCHKTIGTRGAAKKNLVCAGFFHHTPTPVLELAKALEMVIYCELPKEDETEAPTRRPRKLAK